MAKLLGGTIVYGTLSAQTQIFDAQGSSSLWNAAYTTSIANSTWVTANSSNAVFTNSVSARSLSGTFFGDGTRLRITYFPYDVSDATSIRPITGNNVAFGESSVVSGGSNNTACGNSIVGGGRNNLALSCAVAGGGRNNSASAYSFIGGGRNNFATSGGVVGGGCLNTVPGARNVFGEPDVGYNSILGGTGNTVYLPPGVLFTGYFNTIGGGQGNGATGIGSVIGGGISNSAAGCRHATIVGGCSNTASGIYTFIGGGGSNTASGGASTVVGGGRAVFLSNGQSVGNVASGNWSTVVGGSQNTASGSYTFVGGGGGNFGVSRGNTASGTNSSIVGGRSHLVSGDFASILGGLCNTASGNYSTIAGGACNTASGYFSGILGGNNNNTNNQACSFIIGQGITASRPNYTYLNNLSVQGNIESNTNYVATLSLTANQTANNASDTVVTLDPLNDPNNWFNRSTRRFTPTIPGYYHVDYQVAWGSGTAGSGNQNNIQIRRNTTSMALAQQPINSSSVNTTQNTADIAYLNGTTDYLEFTAYSSNAAQGIIGTLDGAWTKVEIFKIN